MTETPRILIVDDERRNRNLLKGMLGNLGHESASVCNGFEALAEVVHGFDLVLLDIMMPIMDGFEVARRIRENPDCCDTPIIMVTALNTREDRLRAVEAGANDYIAKPIDKLELKVRVSSLLKMKEAQDQLKRHQAELEGIVERRTEALRQSERRYRTLFEDCPDPIWVVSREGRVLDVNQAFLDLFGYSRDEAPDIRLSELLQDGTDLDVLRDVVETEGSVKDLRLGLRSKTEICKDCLVTASACREEGGITLGFQGIIRDVTRETTLEKQLREAQKMEALATFAGGMAHDFRNIICAILGFADVSRESVPEGTQLHSTLTHILDAGNRASELVDRILTFSRQSDDDRRPIHVTPIVEECVRFVRASSPKAIEVRARIQPHSGPILADEAQIHRMLMNLCTNGTNAMTECGGVLTVSSCRVVMDSKAVAAFSEMSPGTYLKLTVSDTGEGIPAHVRDRIFEPYFSTRKGSGGTGLGLAMVHGIVQGHGGAISVDSRPGQGTTFSVYFPIMDLDPAIMGDRPVAAMQSPLLS